MTSSTARGSVKAFTLVEILIVVVILAILALIVVPQFTHAASLSRESATKTDLFRIRTQLEIYREQHNGRYPELGEFVRQMTQATDVSGNAPDAGERSYGPYLREMPANPHTGTNVVTDLEPEDSRAWCYDEAEGKFYANHSVEARLW